MKKYIWSILLILCFAVTAKAQIFVVNDNMFAGRMSSIKVKIVDSLTNEPISFASVYVVPAKDTIITNFIVSDTSGVATLKDVPYGNYVFHIEMMGYKHYSKEKYFREERVDLGTVKLKLDENYLSAITVSDVGNPIVMKQDTIEFNASSFRVGANGMLRDLIKRMPGMEITDDGKVKFNGEAIDKLTVGGRTFFFDDQSTALNNLPAAIVDKIRVIDRESKTTRTTGIQDGTREKVLDVGLKKEFEEGWFGNISVKGGTTIEGKKKDEPLRENRGALYNTSALVAAYNKKDQVTFLANGMNVADGGVAMVVRGGEDVVSSFEPGLTSAAQLGLNVNTSRIKDVETTLSANYKYTDNETGSQSYRTTFQENGNLFTESRKSGRSFENGVSANYEMKKEKGKILFSFFPRFTYKKSLSRSEGSSETSREELLVNKSENHSQNNSDSRSGNIHGDITFTDLGGKKGRRIHFSFNGSYSNSDGVSNEQSVLKTAAGEEERTMRYDSKSSSHGALGLIRYTEPLSAKLIMAATANLSLSESESTRDAFDAGGLNSYYSSESKTHYVNQKYDVTAQYKFAKQSWITLGATANGTLNELVSRSYNVNDTTGKGEWNWYVAPTLRLQLSKGSNRFGINISGSSQKPNGSRMLPVLNISNLSRLSLGNIYLRQYSYTNFGINWNRNDRQKFTNLSLYFNGSLTNRPISNALWYDSEGVMYSIPVNSKKPSVSGFIMAGYTTPLDSKKIWTLSLGLTLKYSSYTSYQSTGTLPAIDKDNFDYDAFMADFWGDSKGNRFYDGLSGFKESTTREFSPYINSSLKYNQKNYFFILSAGVNKVISRYSLNKSTNRNTTSTDISLEGSYTTPHQFEISSFFGYQFYDGYAKGYDKPQWNWRVEISKNIGAFNLSVKVNDIFNQRRNLFHTVTANYEEDTYRINLSRYILFGVKWNFGKMNAINSQRAQKAAWNSVF